MLLDIELACTVITDLLTMPPQDAIKAAKPKNRDMLLRAIPDNARKYVEKKLVPMLKRELEENK